MQVPIFRRLLPLLPVALTILGSASAAQAVAGESPQVFRFDNGIFDQTRAITVDKAGNIYLAGTSQVPDTPITFAVVKLDAQGALVWRQTYSGSSGGNAGIAMAVAVDDAGNVYAAGGIGTDSLFNDLLVVKLNSDGVEQWAQRTDIGITDLFTEVAVDKSGAVYASGFFDRTWVTQAYSSDGQVLWTRRHRGVGSGRNVVRDMAVAPNGNLVVVGDTENTGDGVTNDIDVVTYDPQGAIVWQRRFTDTDISDEQARDMDIDPAGRITITGTLTKIVSPEAIPTPLTLQYDASGALLRRINAGGAAVDVDAAGNAYLAGAFPLTPKLSTVAKFDASGAPVWATPLTFRDVDDPEIAAIAVDSAGQVTVAGNFRGNSTSGFDYVTIRYAADGPELWRHRFSSTDNSEDRVAGLVIDGQDAALVGGSSNNLGDSDMVTLRFPAGVTPVAPPEGPTQLTATAQPRHAINLSWIDNSGNEDGFRIERCVGGVFSCHPEDFAEIAVVGPNTTTFLDTFLKARQEYTYRVRAFNADGNSVYSDTASAVPGR